ncbi:MAG: MobH family relaxase [Methylicorpusculum sp.]|uniref:MobH family relaxase n=1 Tax=Methylicorpusculum sp. TaxID=2713644 RepID=UPI00271D6C06|nr:MobH family relaxase [Methylicorpusculum sp.]MDO8941080.1 MobH family relaxase [Methylicorpusculum sp.]MDP2202321.1 MobH family relaxase [Methylicorpusculum sp.]
MLAQLINWLRTTPPVHSSVTEKTESDSVAAQQLMTDYVFRYPPFPKGIPAIASATLIGNNQDLIQHIILARGLAGHHNAGDVDHKIHAPIRHLAELVHLLPASEKNHYRAPGGLFRFSLESGLMCIRAAERRILTRATPEIRRDNEALWTHAAFLTGLFSEAVLVIARIAVYAEEGSEWHPGMETIGQWLTRHQLKRYHIRWNGHEDRSMIYALAGKTITQDQAELLAKGEKAIYKTLLSALHDQDDLNNPLVNINRKVKYKLIERDEAADPSRYGKPLAGMHLEPWLIDAMRHLVEKKRWTVNEENGRLWQGLDGIYLIWPLAASDMQQELRASDSPFVPNTTEILAELMQEAGIIARSKNGYLFDIGIPQADSAELKAVTAIRLMRDEILLEKQESQPLPIQLHAVTEPESQAIVDACLPLDNQSETAPPAETVTSSSYYDDVEYAAYYQNHLPTASNTEPLRFDDQSRQTTESAITAVSINAFPDQHQNSLENQNLLSNLLGDSSADNIHPKPVLPSVLDPNLDPLLKRPIAKSQPADRIHLAARSGLLLDQLKQLPVDCLVRGRHQTTQVFVYGLKHKNLELADCVAVLKAAGLLIPVDGLDTGAEFRKGKSFRYFIVKADLFHGH